MDLKKLLYRYLVYIHPRGLSPGRWVEAAELRKPFQSMHLKEPFIVKITLTALLLATAAILIFAKPADVAPEIWDDDTIRQLGRVKDAECATLHDKANRCVWGHVSYRTYSNYAKY